MLCSGGNTNVMFRGQLCVVCLWAAGDIVHSKILVSLCYASGVSHRAYGNTWALRALAPFLSQRFTASLAGGVGGCNHQLPKGCGPWGGGDSCCLPAPYATTSLPVKGCSASAHDVSPKPTRCPCPLVDTLHFICRWSTPHPPPTPTLAGPGGLVWKRAPASRNPPPRHPPMSPLQDTRCPGRCMQTGGD